MRSFIIILCVAVVGNSAVQYNMQWSPYPSAHKFIPDQQVQASEYSSGGYGSDGGNGGFDYGGGHSFEEHGDSGGAAHAHGGDVQIQPIQSHVDIYDPEPIKHYKEVAIPIPKNLEVKVHQQVIIPVPHPVPIQVPVPKIKVIPVIKEVSIPVEKSVPYPVERIVHVPNIKKVPFEVVKHVPVIIEKPVPFKVPVFETIIHTKKGSH